MTAKTRNLRHGELTIKDGSGSPKTLLVKIAQGDVKWTVKRPSFIIKNRGKIDHRREGDEEAMDVSFGILMEQWSYDDGDTGLSPVDVILGTAIAKDSPNSWVSQDGCGDAWSVSLLFKIYDPCDPTKWEMLEFPNWHSDQTQAAEASEANTISFSGMSLATSPIRTSSED